MPQPRNPDISLTLDMEAVNKMLRILGRQPFEDVADLIMDIRQQAAPQLQQAASANGEDRPDDRPH
jgi:hypothetical protein